MTPPSATKREPAAGIRAARRDLAEHADPAQAEFCLRYFRTGPGEYGEGDQFLGIRAPELRALAKKHARLDLKGCASLLRSRDHEARLLALLILGHAYARADEAAQAEIYDLYLDNTDRINNWDLVDCSAPHIVGRHLEERSRAVLTELARSASLWERRIAIIATHHLIRQGDFAETLRVADVLLEDPHDLIHKAVGWMLREVGNRDRAAEEAFLRPRYGRMPRTMLRYAIEKFPEPLRKRYLKGEA